VHCGKNSGSDPDAVWHVRSSDGSMDEAGFGDRSTERSNWGRANMRRPVVTNGDFFTIGNSHCAATKLLPGEFLEL